MPVPLADLQLTRKDLADILGITTLTIANREQRGIYPPARRAANNYRVYTLADVLKLQLISHGGTDMYTILAILHTKGYLNPKEVIEYLDETYREVLANQSGRTDTDT